MAVHAGGGCEACSYADGGCSQCTGATVFELIDHNDRREAGLAAGHTAACVAAKMTPEGCPDDCRCECHDADG